MEPAHFNWLEARNAVVLGRHEMEKAELKSAKQPADVELRAAYVSAWQAHHAAEHDEFMARLNLV